MVKSVLFNSIFFISATVNAQVQIISAVDSSLYIGIDNIVTLKSSDIPLTQLSLQTSSGTVDGKDGNFIVRCVAKETGAVLKVIHKNNVVANKTININFIYDPIAYAAGDSIFNNGNIPKKQVGRLQLLIAKNNYPLAKWKVASFTFTLLHGQNVIGTADNSSGTFNTRVNTWLRKAMTGDEIIFDNIQILGDTDSRKKALPSIKLNVI